MITNTANTLKRVCEVFKPNTWTEKANSFQPVICNRGCQCTLISLIAETKAGMKTLKCTVDVKFSKFNTTNNTTCLAAQSTVHTLPLNTPHTHPSQTGGPQNCTSSLFNSHQ